MAMRHLITFLVSAVFSASLDLQAFAFTDPLDGTYYSMIHLELFFALYGLSCFSIDWRYFSVWLQRYELRGVKFLFR